MFRPRRACPPAFKAEKLGRHHSLAFGFDPRRPDGAAMPSRALNLYMDDPMAGMGYLTLFPFPDRLRANLYTWWHVRAPRARGFLSAPRAALTRYFPWLSELVGPMAIPGRVETGRIDLYQARAPARAGVLLIGDAFQSVCPSTGTGVSRCLTAWARRGRRLLKGGALDAAL